MYDQAVHLLRGGCTCFPPFDKYDEKLCAFEGTPWPALLSPFTSRPCTPLEELVRFRELLQATPLHSPYRRGWRGLLGAASGARATRSAAP